MTRTFPGVPWCRYADDGLAHCKTEQEARAIMDALRARLAECHLEMHPDKTRIVYCKDVRRKSNHPNTKFDFLGYAFRPRLVKNRRDNNLFVRFTPAVSAKALKAMRQTTRQLNYRNRTDLSLEEICPIAQSCPSRLDRVLWEVLPFSFVSGLQAFQHDVGFLGNEEVPTANGP